MPRWGHGYGLRLRDADPGIRRSTWDEGAVRTVEEVEVHLSAPSGRRDLRQQVVGQLRAAIRDGLFRPGQRLPSSRTLAGHLKVSRATVSAALAELEGEGWVQPRHGSGTYVAIGLDSVRLGTSPARRPDVPRPGRAAVAPDADPQVIDLIPGRPDTTTVPDAAWRRAWREASSGPQPNRESPPAGLDALRTALAEHLHRARGISCRPDQVLVTAGTADALRLLIDATGGAGRTAVVEDPGYPAGHAVLRRAGARLHGVPVDEHGVVPAALASAPADTGLIYLTPSHQYPMGGLLPIERRAALLEWAARRGVILVEDDYDGEFRFGSSPVPPLATLDTAGCTVYVGSFSKVLTPALRLGYLVAAPGLIDSALAVRADTGVPVPSIVQRAVAGYLGNGGLRRHIARQRRVYADRRARLVRRLDALPGTVRAVGLEAGLHVVLRLRPGSSAAEVVRAAAAGGVLVADLDDYRLTPDPGAPGIVLGHGHVTAAQLDRALDVLLPLLR